MGIAVAIVVGVAILSFCAMVTTIAVVAIKNGHKYMEEYKKENKKN